MKFFEKFITISLLLLTVVMAQPEQPKNIILFISDGWGENHIKATDYYEFGETGFVQVYERFPLQMAMATYQAMDANRAHAAQNMEGGYSPYRAMTWFDYVKLKPTDSAAAATAMASGQKSYNGCIGLDVYGNPLENIVERAELLGKATGVVTSVQFAHATPAAFVAHHNYRSDYALLANQMIFDSGLEVIMGCGHPMYNDNGEMGETAGSYKYVGGEETWNALVNGTAADWTLIQTKEEFETLLRGNTPSRVIGIPQVGSTLQQSRAGETATNDIGSLPYTDPMNENVPSLESMTNGALNVLDNNDNGFFLMVEGGAVDWASHANSTPRMIEEQIDFNNAVEAAVQWVNSYSNWDETLIIVTGDHECGYLTGPISGPDGSPEGAEEPVWYAPVNVGRGKLPRTRWHSGDHTNQVIPIYAKGPGAEMLETHADEFDVMHGRYIQNSEIGQTMMNLWPKPECTFNIPKNVVLMISDGWGKNQILATNFYETGQAVAQTYEEFPEQYYMSTFMALGRTSNSEPDFTAVQGAYEPDRAWTWFDYFKQKATDSAASATAFSAGVKTYKYTLGLDPYGAQLENIVQVSEKKGKATGVVSSVQFAHATPAAMAVHHKYRSDYAIVANQMIYGSGLEVIMGCGHPLYDDDGQLKEKPGSFKYVGGQETWDALTSGVAGYDADRDGEEDPWTLVQSKEEFEALITGIVPKRVIGIPMVGSTLQQSRCGATAGNDVTSLPYSDSLNSNVPDLATMTKAALNVMDDDQDGLFLMVEGGAVDWAGHANSTARMIEEQMDFNKAVDAVIEWVEANSNWDETLVIVTGDHECGYLTGPGSGPDGVEEGAATPVWTEPGNNGAGMLPTTEWHSGDHTNQLIPLYAKGAGSELIKLYADQVDSVRGLYTDNAEIGQLMLSLMKLNREGNYVVGKGEVQLLSSVEENDSSLPTEFVLEQNYPNPFNPVTNISFALPHESFVNLSVYDTMGRQVATLVNEMRDAGSYQVAWNAQNFASGVYFYTLKAGSNVLSNKMLLVK